MRLDAQACPLVTALPVRFEQLAVLVAVVVLTDAPLSSAPGAKPKLPEVPLLTSAVDDWLTSAFVGVPAEVASGSVTAPVEAVREPVVGAAGVSSA
jgi:hypothetical protein